MATQNDILRKRSRVESILLPAFDTAAPHFHSSVSSGVAYKIALRSRASTLPRQSPSSAIMSVIRCEAFVSPPLDAFFMCSPFYKNGQYRPCRRASYVYGQKFFHKAFERPLPRRRGDRRDFAERKRRKWPPDTLSAVPLRSPRLCGKLRRNIFCSTVLLALGIFSERNSVYLLNSAGE